MNRATMRVGIALQTTRLVFATPVDDGVVERHSLLSVQRVGNRLTTWALWKRAAAERTPAAG